MGTRRLLLIAGLALAVMAIGAVTVSAQIGEPPPVVPGVPSDCVPPPALDLNHDGQVDWQDFEKWVRQVHWGGDPVYPNCRRDGPASACPLWVDVNGDGMVTVADLDVMGRFMQWCSRPPRIVRPGR